MIIYISGPIQSPIPNTPREELERRFYECEEWIISNTPHIPINPLNIGACNFGQCGHVEGEVDHSWDCYMRHDIVELMKADAVAKLPRWALSHGAKVEIGLATQLGMKVYNTKNGVVLL